MFLSEKSFSHSLVFLCHSLFPFLVARRKSLQWLLLHFCPKGGGGVCSQREGLHVITVYLFILVHLGPLPDPSPLPGSHMGTPLPPAMAPLDILKLVHLGTSPPDMLKTCSLGDPLLRICSNLFTWYHSLLLNDKPIASTVSHNFTSHGQNI